MGRRVATALIPVLALLATPPGDRSVDGACAPRRSALAPLHFCLHSGEHLPPPRKGARCGGTLVSFPRTIRLRGGEGGGGGDQERLHLFSQGNKGEDSSDDSGDRPRGGGSQARDAPLVGRGGFAFTDGRVERRGAPRGREVEKKVFPVLVRGLGEAADQEDLEDLFSECGGLFGVPPRPPQDHRRALGIVLVYGPRGARCLMSEVPLYFFSLLGDENAYQ